MTYSNRMYNGHHNWVNSSFNKGSRVKQTSQISKTMGQCYDLQDQMYNGHHRLVNQPFVPLEHSHFRNQHHQHLNIN